MTGRPFVTALIGTACGAGCVLPLLFVLGVFGGADGRPVRSVVLLVAVIGIATGVFVLPALLRRRSDYRND